MSVLVAIMALKVKIIIPRYVEQHPAGGSHQNPGGCHEGHYLFLEAAGLDNDPGDGVGVAVGAGPPVLEVPVARLGHVPGR